MEPRLNTSDIVGIWIGVTFTLAIMTFLIKDNPLYRVVEMFYIGIANGYMINIEYWNVLFNFFISKLNPELGVSYQIRTDPAAIDLYLAQTHQELWVIIPAIFGIFIVLRLVPGLAWLSKYSFTFVIGIGSGFSIPQGVFGVFLPQLVATLKPIPMHKLSGWGLTEEMAKAKASHFWSFMYSDAIVGLVLLVGVFSVLVYFFFSVDHKGIVYRISRVGVLFIMICFGALFGTTVLGRMSLLIGRMSFLINPVEGGLDKKAFYPTIWLLSIFIILWIVFEFMSLRKGDGKSHKRKPATS